MASAGNRRRVLIIVENESVPFDRRVWQEAQTLRDAGYDVMVICPTDETHSRRREVLDGIEIYRHPISVAARGWFGYVLEYGNALAWEFFLALMIFFTKGFDVIQGCNPPDTIFLVAAPFKLLGKRYIFDQHDICPELFEAKFGARRVLRHILTILERLSFFCADAAIVTNESYRELALERARAHSDRLFVVRNGPDLDRVRLRPPQPKLRRGRRFLVGYVGVMGKQEGIDILLRGVKHIVEDRGRNDIQFGLVGGGSELQRLKAYAHELGVSDYVTFTGRVPDDEMLEMLSTADVCVNPDVPNAMNDKSTMIKIMEYMALNKPIVQFDLREGRYSAGDASLYARWGDVVDFANKIIQLLDDPQERQLRGNIGYERVLSELAWVHQVPKLLRAYEAAAGKKERAISIKYGLLGRLPIKLIQQQSGAKDKIGKEP